MEIVSEKHRRNTCLNSRNSFCDELKNLQPGFHIHCVCFDAGAVRFEIEEVFEDVVCIELNGECVLRSVSR